MKCYTSVSIVRRLIRKRSSWIDDLDELIAITAERKFGHVSNNDNYKKYLVDPASSHMLVSKIKPCMSKHMP